MLVIFGDDRGMAAAHITPGLPAVLRVEGWNADRTFKAALCAYRFGGQGAHQYLHTLRDVIYVYTFGERVGQVELSGFAFQGLCGQDKTTTGIDDIKDFYDNNRLSSRGTPILISLGITTALQAFLVGFGVGIADPQSGLAQFTLSLTYPPKQKAR